MSNRHSRKLYSSVECSDSVFGMNPTWRGTPYDVSGTRFYVFCDLPLRRVVE